MAIGGLILLGFLFGEIGTGWARNLATRGVITLDGVPGLFLNPTSGTLQKGEVSFQACISSQDWLGDRVWWKGMFGAYGVSDRLELGFSHAGLDNRSDGKSVDANGPALRYRFMEEAISGWEGSFGCYWRPGTKYVARSGANLAFSRRIGTVGSTRREVRLHAGIRGFWQDGWWIGKWLGSQQVSLAKDDATLGYGGLEVGLPGSLSLIGEVSTKGGYFSKTPWAFGLQYKMAGGFGCSLGAVQPGYARSAGFFFGIGINFD
jgi:hypothetical protein